MLRLGFVLGLVVVVVVVVVLSTVDIGDPRCPIHGEDVIFTHKL